MAKEESHTLDDAIDKTTFGKFNCIMIVIFGLVLACGFLETSSINMILPIAQCELNLSNFHKGFLGSVSYIGIILSSHFWGFMADTKGRKKVVVPALILSFIFTVISTFSKSFWFLALFRFLNGFCICASQTIIYAFLGEFCSMKHRDRVLLVSSVIYGMFCLINPLNGILFLNHEHWNIYIPIIDLNYGTWRIFMLMCGIPSLLSVIGMIFFIPESPKFTYAQGNEAQTLEILTSIFTYNTGKSADEYEVKSLIKDQEFLKKDSKSVGFLRFMWSQTTPLFKYPNLKNTMTACYLQFAVCLAANGFWTFLPETLNKVSIWQEKTDSESSTLCQVLSSFDIKSNVTAYIQEESLTCVTKLELSTFTNVTILLLLHTTILLVISFLIRKVGKLAIIVTFMFMCGSSSILLMIVQIPEISIYLYFAMLLVIVNMSVINASTVELFPTASRAMAVSISMMAGRIGSFAGSNFVGLSIKNYCSYTWLLPAILLFCGGFLAFTIPNINRKTIKS
ncbi:synaptic vesicle glycoprotein 2B-like [Chironomus tepperi]|uniref:synaptic vesicle glycoprotein 2B-like n=1 Tax=Chironomus tepperi TaxID=113505 RepID=UPI00391F5CEA